MEHDGRRQFLQTCIGGVAVAAAGAVAYPVISYLAPRTGKDNSAAVTIPEKDVPSDGAKFFQYHGKAAVIVRKKDGSLTALSAVCTHLGCIVQWEAKKGEFICPCHGGQFSTEGKVLGGPPPKPLEQLKATVANGVITIG
jgi:cytochrome b6-f complex iron-sulfur subunit